MIKKYAAVFKLTLIEYFVYRLNFLLWRFRSFVSFLVLIFFWQAIYRQKGEIFGYSEGQMLTYVVGAALLKGLIFGSRTADLAGMIKDGELARRFLSKPWNILAVFFSRDLAAKSLDLVFVLLEMGVVVYFLHLSLYFPAKIQLLAVFLLASVISLLLYFFIDFFLAISAFWLDNVWAPRWLLGIIFLEFCSGLLFPLDILPSFLTKAINLTPFPYLLYYPLKIYLGQISSTGTTRVLSIMFFWLVLFIFLSRRVWRAGLRRYSAYGG